MSRVSIIMPAYNASKTILDSINSVLVQTYNDWELIVCDDGSHDDTAVIVTSVNDPRIKLINNHLDKGAAGARSSAIQTACGRFVAFLDADDIWHPEKLATQVAFMIDQGCVFSYGDYYIFRDHPKNIIGLFKTKESVTFDDICKTCDIGCLTVMIDRNRFPDLQMVKSPKEDYATWLNLLKHENMPAMKYPGLLASYRVSNSSISSNKFIELRRQYFVLKNTAKLSFIYRLYCLVYYVLKGFYKHFIFYKTW
ncbi:UDP-Glc:alpha-D-GlcNAc-diphosphoundecaprenol beta-1,3-glucosyltransferase WfgD [Gammaproteobacteria bacterium]